MEILLNNTLLCVFIRQGYPRPPASVHVGAEACIEGLQNHPAGQYWPQGELMVASNVIRYKRINLFLVYRILVFLRLLKMLMFYCVWYTQIIAVLPSQIILCIYLFKYYYQELILYCLWQAPVNVLTFLWKCPIREKTRWRASSEATTISRRTSVPWTWTSKRTRRSWRTSWRGYRIRPRPGTVCWSCWKTSSITSIRYYHV